MIPNDTLQNPHNSRIVFDEEGLKFSYRGPFTHNTGLPNRPHQNLRLARFQRLWLRLAHRVLLCLKPFQHVLLQGLSPVLTLLKRLPSSNCDTDASDNNNAQVFPPDLGATPRQQWFCGPPELS